LDSSSESEGAMTSGSSSSETDDDKPGPTDAVADQGKYKIPKDTTQGRAWNAEELAGFRRMWPNLAFSPDSFLINATRNELANMGRSRTKESRVLTTRHVQNYEIASRPVRVEGGVDECAGQVHPSRFLRGYVGDPQDLWLQARASIDLSGLAPITNYEQSTLGVGDLLTARVWEEIHNPGSRLLSIQMLSPKSVDAALLAPDKTDAPKAFDSLNELKMAVATLDTAIQRIMPWNLSFRTMSLFLLQNDFGVADLTGKTGRLSVTTGFVNEIILSNARSWVEKRKYLSHQELSNKWPSFLARNSVLIRAEEKPKKTNSRQKPNKSTQGGFGKNKPRIPRWICLKFNNGSCKDKDRHESLWDPNFSLRHVCSKIGTDGMCCKQNHPENGHK